MSTALLWSKRGASAQFAAVDTKSLIYLVYFINVTEYFTTLTGQDDSRKEKIAWFVDGEAESEYIPTLDHVFTGCFICAVSAYQMKEMATDLPYSPLPERRSRPANKWLEAL